MPVHDRPHVGTRAVHLRVERRLEVQVRVAVLEVAPVEVDHDHVLGAHLLEREPLALDQDRLPPRHARADVAEGQVGVALGGEDAAGMGDVPSQGLNPGDGGRAA